MFALFFYNIFDMNSPNRSSILIIDDDPFARRYLEILLGAGAYTLLFAANGTNGLNLAKKTQPDIVLLDINMPDIDGFEVCRLIRADKQLAQVPVLMITSLDDRESKLKGMEIGADDFIIKPFDSTELVLRIQTITRLNRYRLLMIEREKAEEAQKKQETIKRLSEKALFESEQKFKNLAGLSPVGIFFTDAQGNYKNVNRQWTKISSLSEEQARTSNFFANIHPDDRTHVKTNWDEAQNLKIPFVSEFRFINSLLTSNWVICQALQELDAEGNITGYVGMITDISQRMKREKENLKAILNAQENERHRFAVELHDGVGQTLSALKMYLNAIDFKTIDNENASLIENALAIASQAINEIRSISHNLMPKILKDYGVIHAVNSIIQLLFPLNTFNVKFTHNIKKQLSSEIEIAIYRIVQEALNNIIKHSKATKISINLEQENSTIKLIIADNGVGFNKDLSSTGLGLLNMQNRVKYLDGKFNIETQKTGTCIAIEFPF